MHELSLEKVFDLLGRTDIAGSDQELKKLCIRIGELAQLNGDQWVKDNRRKLLDEWDYIVRNRLIS